MTDQVKMDRVRNEAISKIEKLPEIVTISNMTTFEDESIPTHEAKKAIIDALRATKHSFLPCLPAKI